MVNLTIDNKQVQVPEGTSILHAAKQAGIDIPTLCYLKEINEIGACRVCLVDVEHCDKLVASCNTPVEEGMVVRTNTPRVREARRTNVELILSQHNGNCVSCARSGNCKLQTISNNLYFETSAYPQEIPKQKWSKTFPMIRDDSKCIKCMRCVQICEKVQGLGVWDVVNTGGRTTVSVSGLRNIEESDCALCGQCITHCPTGALHARNDSIQDFSVYGPISQEDKIKIVQVAPAVRAAWAENFDLTPEEATPRRLVGVLKKIGFDYVFDTNFSADLTIMEESAEVLARMTDGQEHKYPLFTSCCPGWVRFLKSQYPDMVNCLSTSKSPQQMFGAIAKSYFAEKIGVEPERIYSVSVMPCLAKKSENAIPTINDAKEGQKDVDSVLTTRELIRLIKRENINVREVEEMDFDSPLGTGTGAAVIFGATGGVMEAALRTAHFKLTGANPDPDAFEEFRVKEEHITDEIETVEAKPEWEDENVGAREAVAEIAGQPWKEARYRVAGIPVNVAVVSGLANTRKLIRALRKGLVSYDFVEVMACPGGCVGGGGQPIHDGEEWACARAQILYDLDEEAPIRFSHENPEVQELYKEYLETPLSEKAHHLLHTDHEAWKMPLSPNLDADVKIK